MKKLFAAFLLSMAAFSAQAVVVNSNINPNGVDYTYFNLDADSLVHLETLYGQFDPYMYLFRDDGSLDAADYIAQNDDGGTPALSFYNSLLNINLTAGNYVVVVGDFYLSIDEAINGYADNSFLSGGYSLLMTANNGNITVTNGVPVPEPTTLGLLGLGLLGFGFARRKNRQ
ncbi:MAG: DVUA0089 family protein [Gammaproteobacteria bacterium]|nr:DVUA0089 family protein [Gammaproteobacteria bacterium]